MRLKISHTTEYRYGEPVFYALQRLRITPLSGPGQRVIDWRIRLEGAVEEVGYHDEFGNRIDLVSTSGGQLLTRITAEGLVETTDLSGVTGPHTGFCPLWLYLRETSRTRPGRLLRDLARSLPAGTDLEQMHALMAALHTAIDYRTGTTHTETTAEQAMEQGFGVCQDHAHAMVSVARLLGLPARYVSGYLFMDGVTEQVASHAWAEVMIKGLGWVGFDAANRICPDGRYVRLAVGLDYQGAAPVAGMRMGLAEEHLHVALTVEDHPSQSQSQSQN